MSISRFFLLEIERKISRQTDALYAFRKINTRLVELKIVIINMI
jgi:hypothetical protein